MENYLYAGLGLLLGLAATAAIMDRRRNNRDELDRVGWVNWPLVLVLALIGAMMCVMLIAAAT
ncbi:MAG: hypothetical protein ABR601_03640 [Parasphingopyxis sp.]